MTGVPYEKKLNSTERNPWPYTGTEPEVVYSKGWGTAMMAKKYWDCWIVLANKPAQRGALERCFLD